MKKRLTSAICVFLIIVMITTMVQAVNDIRLKITLPQDYITQTPQDEDMKQYYIQNHIYLHAVNEKKDESVIVVQLENDFTKRITNLAELNEQNRNTILEQYNKEKEQEGQAILKQETYQKGDLLFIDMVFEQTSEQRKVQIEEYYTIVEGKAVVISVHFLEKQVDTDKVRQMIDSVEISKKETTQGINHGYVWGMFGFAIVLMVLYTRKQTKMKINLAKHEEKSILARIEKRLNGVMQYDKFKGGLLLFVVTLIVNGINLCYTSFQMLIQYRWLQGYTMVYKIYIGLVLLQNLLQLIGLIYIAYCLTKRQRETIRRVQKTFLGMLIGVTILTVIRLVLQASMKMSEDFIAYSISEMKILVKSILYLFVWYLYYKNSIRVSIYYKERSLQQIIEEPKKGYQTNLVNKRIMEVKIIDYFTTQKAFDYASGIYINQLPKEYARNIALSDLTSKKIIKLKRAKYYLNQKNLENPKMETRKATKTVALMVVIYVLVVLLISTI